MLPAAILACLLSAPAPTLSIPFDLQPSVAVVLHRFPAREESLRLWHRARSYRNFQRDSRHLGATAMLLFAARIAEAEAAERAWDVLTDAQHAATWSEDSAREHLEELRALLGEDAYAGGWMPFAVPDWFDAKTFGY